MENNTEERELWWDIVDEKAKQDNTIDLSAYTFGVIDGIEWQSKKMFTVEDLEKAFAAGEAFRLGTHELFKQTHPNFQEWIRQYKTQ